MRIEEKTIGMVGEEAFIRKRYHKSKHIVKSDHRAWKARAQPPSLLPPSPRAEKAPL